MPNTNIVVFPYYQYNCPSNMSPTDVFLSMPGLSDDNECSSNNGLGPCEQICVNNLLGYECLCRPGYNLNADGKTCSGKKYLTSFVLDTDRQTQRGNFRQGRPAYDTASQTDRQTELTKWTDRLTVCITDCLTD